MTAPKSDGFTRLLIAMFVIPAPFEITLGVVKGDSYDFRRLGIILGTLLLLALVLSLLRGRVRWYPQVIVGVFVLLIGLALAAFGATTAIWGDEIRSMPGWSAGVDITVTTLAPSLGLLMLVAGAYLVRERLVRAKEEHDTPLPERISMAKMIPLNQHTSAEWRADDPTHQKGRDALVKICQGFLAIGDLHFVAYYTKSAECDFYVDLFDDAQLEPLVSGESGDRRSDYVAHGRHIRHLVTKLDVRFTSLETGRLVRVVLDVEQGAIYYYDLGNQGFLIGVTLDQQKVDPTDWKMSNLANAMLRAKGQQEDDDFYRLCPMCHKTNRGQAHDHPPADASNVTPIQRPRNGSGS